MNNRKSGIEGENSAVEYLKKLGYVVLERNFTTKVGEIDIIADDKGTVVFVEVKARENTKFGQPIESITYQKVRSIKRTAEWYLTKMRMHDRACRFDVIEILRGNITHIKDAFQ